MMMMMMIQQLHLQITEKTKIKTRNKDPRYSHRRQYSRLFSVHLSSIFSFRIDWCMKACFSLIL